MDHPGLVSGEGFPLGIYYEKEGHGIFGGEKKNKKLQSLKISNYRLTLTAVTLY